LRPFSRPEAKRAIAIGGGILIASDVCSFDVGLLRLFILGTLPGTSTRFTLDRRTTIQCFEPQRKRKGDFMSRSQTLRRLTSLVVAACVLSKVDSVLADPVVNLSGAGSIVLSADGPSQQAPEMRPFSGF